MTAGPHTIAATFVARTMSESDAVLQPFMPGGGEVGIIEGEESPLKIQRLEINGPFTAAGMSDTPSRAAHLHLPPADAPAEEPSCAREIVTRLTRAGVSAARDRRGSRDPAASSTRPGAQPAVSRTGVRNALMIVLASPEFLYRFTAPPDDSPPGSVYAVDSTGSRRGCRSSSGAACPTRSCSRSPSAASSSDRARLAAQVERMLADPRAAALVTNFAQQWLDIRGVRDIVPDPVLFPEYNPDLGNRVRARARAVPRRACCSRIAACSSCLTRQAHVLERAARAALRRAGRARRQLPPRRARGREPLGLVRQGRHLDGDLVPEPHGARAARRVDPRSHHGHAAGVAAADVEAFPETQEGEQPKTVRERLEVHRANPTCNACHGVMDPLGFALENFDAIGAWRVKDREALAADRLVGPARRRHRRQRARRLA